MNKLNVFCIVGLMLFFKKLIITMNLVCGVALNITEAYESTSRLVDQK